MSVSQISGYVAIARVRVGSNGSPSGVPECLVGTPNSDSSGRRVWDVDLVDGLDSGFTAVGFTAVAAGGTDGLVLSVNQADPTPITFAGASAMAIRMIKVRSAVDGANYRASFRNIVVKFFLNASDTTATETRRISSTSAPVADTFAQVDPVSAEAVVNVTPLRTDYQKATVSADVRFESANAEPPGEEDMFGEVFVFAQ